MSEHNLKQSDVAKKSTVNPAYVNIMLKEDSNFMYDAGGKKGLIPALNFYKIAQIIGYSAEPSYWETQPTEQMTQTISVLQDSKQHGTTNVIVGETGSGKSYTVNLFAMKNPLDTFIVVVGASDTLHDLITKLGEAVMPSVTGSKSQRLTQIGLYLSSLRGQGLKPQIIFDESEYMRVHSLCAVKQLYDGLIGICSIVLIGTHQLVQNIEKLKNRDRAGIPQFYRRIKFGIRTLPPIDRRYDQFIADVEDVKLRKWLQKYCTNYGELHDAMVPALREAERTSEPLTIPFMKKVLNLPEHLYV